MRIETKQLTREEFREAVAEVSSVYDPDFLAFLKQLQKDRRLIVDGLTRQQMSFIRRKWPKAVHIKKYHMPGKPRGVKLVYLQEEILAEFGELGDANVKP